MAAQAGKFVPRPGAVRGTEQGGILHPGVDRVGVVERGLKMPDALEFPGVLRAVIPHVGGEGLAAFRRGVVDEFIARPGREFSRPGNLFAAGGRPRLAAVVGPLEDLVMAWKVRGLLAEPRDHGLSAGLDALGDSDLAFARKEFHRRHFAEVQTHRVVGSLGGFLGLRFNRNRLLPNFDYFVFPRRFLFLLRLVVGHCLFAGIGLVRLDNVHAHLAELRQNVLDLLGFELF